MTDKKAPVFPIEQQRPDTIFHGGSGQTPPPAKQDDLADHKKKGYLPDTTEDVTVGNMTSRAHPPVLGDRFAGKAPKRDDLK